MIYRTNIEIYIFNEEVYSAFWLSITHHQSICKQLHFNHNLHKDIAKYGNAAEASTLDIIVVYPAWHLIDMVIIVEAERTRDCFYASRAMGGDNGNILLPTFREDMVVRMLFNFIVARVLAEINVSKYQPMFLASGRG